MKNIVGVRFKKPGKIYFFDPEGLKIERRKLCNCGDTARTRIW